MFLRHGGRLLGAGIAFYSMLSVAPIFVLALYIAGLVTREDFARAALLHNMAGWVGEDGAHTLEMLIDRARGATNGTLASGLSILVLLYASTRLFAALERAINVMWGVETADTPSVRDKALHLLRKRGMGLLMVIGVGGILLGLVGLHLALSLAASYVPHAPHLSRAVEAMTSFGITVALFFLLFMTLPAARIAWADAAWGALFTATFFSLGSHAIAAYVSHKDIAAHYGDAGTVVMLLLWVQYCAQIFLIGAAFTGARARRRGTLGSLGADFVIKMPASPPPTSTAPSSAAATAAAAAPTPASSESGQ